MRKLAGVRMVAAAEPIPGADAIERLPSAAGGCGADRPGLPPGVGSVYTSAAPPRGAAVPPLPRWLVPITLLAAGCEFDPPVPSYQESSPPQPPVAASASTFDPARCGTVAGRVTWAGPPPVAEDFLFGEPVGNGHFQTRFMPNPNRPAVSLDGAVAGAVVFLRGIDPARAKPWDLPPVRVEMTDRQIIVRQGDGPPRRVGFVRRGDPVRLASADGVYHVLRARGAAFFSLTFPDADSHLERTLDQAGRVELSSGAGFYWASADLFVSDHPYLAVTGADGRYSFGRVPAGEIEVVAGLPGWLPAARDRDTETGLITRMTYSPPVEAVGQAALTPGSSVTVPLTLGK